MAPGTIVGCGTPPSHSPSAERPGRPGGPGGPEEYNLDSCVGLQYADEVQQYLQDFLKPLEKLKDANTPSNAKSQEPSDAQMRIIIFRMELSITTACVPESFQYL
ncbi:hypothetical protein E2C01_031516 [Portunus trituberculatus]|uniref:Uncharacterized protein n=1 Tax=Portunus trituberculatus TaxID=210409 RepID=A0A5B7EXW0_PORTR|nr:hypothetical protein [Portunus trituberculatus]